MTTELRPESLEFDKLACITIQGGGVYGLTLLGQLHAVRKRGFLPVSLAGTSAGAIVATLDWAGLEPDDVLKRLIDTASEEPGLLKLVGPFEKGPDEERIGPVEALDTVSQLSAAGRDLMGAVAGRDLISKSGWLWRNLFWWVPIADGYLKVKGLRPALERAGWAWKHRGLFTGEALQDFLDRLLRDSPILEHNARLLPPPRGEPNGRWLTFRDFKRIQDEGRLPNQPREARPYFPPLFLAATEVTTRRLELINSVETRYLDWPVVKAVRASAGFPGFFRPVDHDVFAPDPTAATSDAVADGERSYVDGGVIANFPAFVFGNRFRRWLADTATAHDPVYATVMTRPWVHVGLRLSSVRQERPAAGEREQPATFVRAMLDLLKGLARNELEERLTEFVPRSIQVSTDSAQTGGPAGVLDVNALRPHIVRTMFNEGYKTVKKALERYKFSLPDAQPIEGILEDALELAGTVFRADPTKPGSDPKFRANVFVPQRTELVLAYRANMDPPRSDTPVHERNTDRELRLDYRYGLSGLCYAKRQPLILNLKRYQPGQDWFGFANRTQDLIRRDRSWLLSVPIFDPEAVLPGRLPAEPVDQVTGSDYAVELDGVAEPNPKHVLDGAVFGVLNLDAGWVYSAVALQGGDDPNLHRNDIRIRALVAIMRSCALRIGALFSERFPSTNS